MTESIRRVLGAVVVAAFCGLNASAQQPTTDENLAEAGLRQLEAQEAAFRRAIDRAVPSTVAIYVMEANQPQLNGFDFGPGRGRFRNNGPGGGGQGGGIGQDDDISASGMGCGIVIDRGGKILTAYHVVRPAYQLSGRYELVVRTPGGKRFNVSRDRILAADPRSDLAVIRVGDNPADYSDLRPITIADGTKLFRGQHVLALGNPFGAATDGIASASAGIISNIGRRAEPVLPGVEAVERVQTLAYSSAMIQTDCRLNTGVSGGPLVNLRGELVGINMALAARTGMETPGGFALPTDELFHRVVESLSDGREMEYGFLGITPYKYTPEPNDAANSPPPGVLVGRIVLPTSIRAGLQKDDVITAVNGHRVTTPSELVLRVGCLPAGTQLQLETYREKTKRMVKLKLGKFPVTGEVIATKHRPVWNGIRVDHLSTLVNRFESEFGGPEMPSGGVAVRDIQSGSPAESAGINRGSVITKVNGVAVYDPEEFEQAVAAAKGNVKLTFTDSRDYRDATLPPPTAKPLKRPDDH